MVILERKLRYKIRLILESVLYGDSDNWNVSNDSDWPAPTKTPFPPALRSRNVVFIERPQEYFGADPRDLNHGGFSHAIKHAVELNPEHVLGITKKIMRYVQSVESHGHSLFYVSKRTKQSTQISGSALKPGDILNTLDWINDELYDGMKLPIYYERMYKMAKPIYDLYYSNLRTTMEHAIDVSDGAFPNVNDLINFLKSKPIIKFEASFKNKGNSLRILDMANSVIYGQSPNGKIATYFMQEKKPKRHTIQRILATIAPIRKDGSNSNTLVSSEYSNLRNIAAMAVMGEL